MKINKNESGNTIIIAIVTTVALSTFVGIAVNYTAEVGRNAQRNRIISTAVEIGDGTLELAFASWRKICSNQATPTNPLPSTTFSPIPAPALANFPVVPDTGKFLTTAEDTSYTISNFKVQPVDPLLDPLPTQSATPTKSTGPGTGTFSYFYLASADVTLPALKGKLTAKVRRVFEQRVTSPWNWAIMYNDNLELSPASDLTLNGWIHTNGILYTASDKLTLTDRLTYVSDWNIGWDPNDTFHSGQTATAPAYPADLPPASEQPYIPFGWDKTKLVNTSDSSTNNDSLRELIERPAAGTDTWENTRYYNQASIAILIDANNVMTVYHGTGASKTDVTNQSGGSAGATAVAAAKSAIHTGDFIRDNREGTVRIVDFDVDKFMDFYPKNTTKSWNGIIYISDTSGSAVIKRGIRVINGGQVPEGGITIASENPVYIKGDFNSGRTSSIEPPSNTGDPTDSEATGYTRQPSLIAADAVMLMSNNWNDSNHDKSLTERIASPTTVNAALIAGNVATSLVNNYSGGAENFVRFLEDWTGKSFTYYGSMIQLYQSAQANSPWATNAINTYASPSLKWYFDSNLTTNSPPSTQSSNMTTVSYLQAQRWFVTYQPQS
jgi:hypothetical protein